MKTRYEAELDGVTLSSLSPAVIITDIAEDAPEVRRTTARFAALGGTRMTREVRESLRVSVTFELHEGDVRRRAQLCERVVKWAQGRILKVNHRPGQRLGVVCETPPAIGSALRWTQPLTVVFAAQAIPFWEDAVATRVTILGDGDATAYVPGTAQAALVEATVENTGDAAITAVTLSVSQAAAAGAGQATARGTLADTAFTFSGLSIPPGGRLAIAYDDKRVLRARIGDTSVLAKRTTASSDDLLAPCGQRSTFAVSGTGGAAKTTFSVRGWYL